MGLDFGYADILVILLITIGPLKATIVYVKLTGGASREFRRQVAFKTVTVAAIVCLLFVFAGHILLNLFHVSLPALKIAGGLILLLFALDMVMGNEDAKKGGSEDGKLSPHIAIYPLAMPLMATPQGLVAITTVVATKNTLVEMLAVAAMVLVIMGMNLGLLLCADKLVKSGSSGVMIVVGKIIGLLLAALAIQLMISALRDLGVLAPLAH